MESNRVKQEALLANRTERLRLLSNLLYEAGRAVKMCAHTHTHTSHRETRTRANKPGSLKNKDGYAGGFVRRYLGPAVL